MTPTPAGDPAQKQGISGRIAAFFQVSPLTPLLMVGAVLLGAFALIVTPREEEPQVDVTFATVTIPFPGASVTQVEQMVAIPAEQLLSQISGLEHITSVSRPGVALLTLQYEVGIRRTDALVRLHDTIQSNKDFLPHGFGVGEPIVKSMGIDDVPVMTLALFSPKGDIGPYELARIAHALEIEIKQIDGTRDVVTLGSPERSINIDLDPDRMRAAGITVADLRRTLQDANFALPAGDIISGNRRKAIDAGTLIRDTEQISNLIVGIHDGTPILLENVATVAKEPAQPDRYVWYGQPMADDTQEYPAVTLAITKKPGRDASLIGLEVKRKLDALKNQLIPPSVEIVVTRDYGAIGVDKSLRLIYKLLFATVAVVALVWLMLGWREALLVGVAVSLTLALTLFASWSVGYTLNRASLFALIVAIGILVDDAIVVAENIHRHMALTPSAPMTQLIPRAVDEVGGPTILATFAVIAALMPIFNVSGMLAPYSYPVALIPSMGMLLSLCVAFTVTPWMARWCLRPSRHGDALTARITPMLRKLGNPFLDESIGRRNRLLLFFSMPLLVAAVCLLPLGKWVILRTMPYDNREVFQVIVDMPPNSPVERTAALMRDLSQYMATVPEVKNYQSYAGAPAPIDFAGLVRQYNLRDSGEFGTLIINLVDRHERKALSHDIAQRVRPRLHEIAAGYGAVLRVVEPVPGPPFPAAILAEVYGPDDEARLEVSRAIKKVFDNTPGIMDTFDSSIVESPKQDVIIDRRKAATLGVSQSDIVTTLRAGLKGEDAAYLHDIAKYPTPLRVQLPPENRGVMEDSLRLAVRASHGGVIPISELVELRDDKAEQPIFHKDLRPVIYVGGDLAGRIDSPVYGMFEMRDAIRAIKTPMGSPLSEHLFLSPQDTIGNFSVKWDGEWRLTYETFRDIGVGFGVAMILIYLLIVAHFGSYLIPLIIMVPIPLTIIGVLPGHLLTNTQFSSTSGFAMMILAGIIVRNTILLVDFIHLETAKGKPLREAVIDAPLVRAQPILLTALAAMLSGYFILGDQVFDGLGITLIFGVFASTMLTLVLIPLLYYHFHHKLPVKQQ